MNNTNTQNTIIIVQHVLISLTGIVGNLLVLLVYIKKLNDKQTITFFIVHLSVTDLACCLFLIPVNMYHELNIEQIRFDFMCKFHTFLNIINITYSCLLMTLVALERYLTIIWPLKKLVTKFRAKIAMLVLFVTCLVIGLLGCLSVGIYHKVYIASNTRSLDNNATNINDLSAYGNLTSVWIPTYNCFPNNQIIPFAYFSYIRLLQNMIIIGCFVV